MPLPFISPVISFSSLGLLRVDRNLSGQRETRPSDLKMAEVYLCILIMCTGVIPVGIDEWV